MTEMDHPQLQELVDAPMERLEVEYKAWLDLSHREDRADLAKHLCVIANHGGGFVVFGIADDMTPVTLAPRDPSSALPGAGSTRLTQCPLP